MRNILFAGFVALALVGCGDEQGGAEKEDNSTISGVDGIVNWVMENYSSIEDEFGKAESDLRDKDIPIQQVLGGLKASVSNRTLQSRKKKKELVRLKQELLDKQIQIEEEIKEAGLSMRESYQSSLSKIEDKLNNRIKHLEDFDFPYLEKLNMELNASMIKWTRYVELNADLLGDKTVRMKVADFIASHFRENLTKPIQERRESWEKTVVSKRPKKPVVQPLRRPISEFEEKKRLAERGDAEAQTLLGWKYDTGGEVPQDYKEAFKWYRLGAKQGNSAAQYNLGLMYAKGKGVPADDKEAVKWYGLAAEQGHAWAQHNLGWMYNSGTGVYENLVHAYAWYNLAQANGNASAKQLRDKLKLTKEQLAEALALSAELQRQIRLNIYLAKKKN